MPAARVNGYDLHYEDDDFADPWRPHDAILMQHHLWGSHAEFRPWVPTLSREYRVIRMDRRGNGLSSKPPLGYQYKVADLLSDFLGFLDALQLEKVHYIGASMGGILGAAFAASHPERVKSLVLCQTPGSINVHHSTHRDGFALDGYPDGPTAVMAMGSWAFFHSLWIRNLHANATGKELLPEIHMAEQRALVPAYAAASLMRMASGPDVDITPILPMIKAPTLILSPGVSRISTKDEQRMMKERIPNCQQVVFEGAGHGIAWTMPDRCALEALEFIRAQSG